MSSNRIPIHVGDIILNPVSHPRAHSQPKITLGYPNPPYFLLILSTMTLDIHVVEHLHHKPNWMRYQTYQEARIAHLQSSYVHWPNGEGQSQEAPLVGMMPTGVYSVMNNGGGDTRLIKPDKDHTQPTNDR